jgi:hypothetical protein
VRATSVLVLAIPCMSLSTPVVDRSPATWRQDEAAAEAA